MKRRHATVATAEEAERVETNVGMVVVEVMGDGDEGVRHHHR